MEHTDSDLPVLKILTSPRVLIALLTCTVGAYSIGTVEATLSSFLDTQLQLSVQNIALAFLVMSVCSVVATPVFGWMCDARVSGWLVSVAGASLMILCYAFLGPAPYLAFYSPNFTTVCTSLVAQGFGSAAVLVASFGCAQRAAVAAGFPECIEVQAVISGMFTSSFALGNFTGPTLSGIIYENLGFSYNCLVLQLLIVLLLVLNTVCYCVPQETSHYQMIPEAPQYRQEDRRSSVFPELPADVIRSRPVASRPKIRKISVSSSVYEKTVVY